MEIDGDLVMSNFIAHMSDLLLLMLCAVVAAAVIAGVFSYFEHYRGDNDEDQD
jgi:hypothetical protein